jgi:hypothetical protein
VTWVTTTNLGTNGARMPGAARSARSDVQGDKEFLSGFASAAEQRKQAERARRAQLVCLVLPGRQSVVAKEAIVASWLVCDAAL